jgi:hypothetical protein
LQALPEPFDAGCEQPKGGGNGDNVLAITSALSAAHAAGAEVVLLVAVNGPEVRKMAVNLSAWAGND